MPDPNMRVQATGRVIPVWPDVQDPVLEGLPPEERERANRVFGALNIPAVVETLDALGHVVFIAAGPLCRSLPSSTDRVRTIDNTLRRYYADRLPRRLHGPHEFEVLSLAVSIGLGQRGPDVPTATYQAKVTLGPRHEGAVRFLAVHDLAIF